MPSVKTSQAVAFRNNPEPNPPWLQHLQANIRNCFLYRLPPELMVKIVAEHTDSVTMQIMRRTCGLFLRTISDLEIRKFNVAMLKGLPITLPLTLYHQNDRLVWPLHGSNEERKEQKPQVTALLHRDSSLRFCDGCQTLDKTESRDEKLERLRHPLWCSGCGENHASLFFSSRQRSVPSEQRICIGREGSIRLCDHEVLTWEAVEKAVAEYRASDSDSPDGSAWRGILECAQQHMHGTGEAPMHQDRPKVRVSLDGDAISIQRFEIPVCLFDSAATSVTRDQLRQLITSAEPGNTALCPHVSFTDGQLALPFEPNQCACFGQADEIPDGRNDADSKHITTAKPLAHCQSVYVNCDCCRCQAVKSSGNPAMSHCYYCSSCDMNFRWNVWDYGGLVLTSHASIILNGQAFGPSRPDWLQFLDPHSWGITEDEDLRHIAWCADQQCATMFRWERLLELFRSMNGEKQPKSLVKR